MMSDFIHGIFNGTDANDMPKDPTYMQVEAYAIHQRTTIEEA